MDYQKTMQLHRDDVPQAFPIPKRKGPVRGEQGPGGAPPSHTPAGGKPPQVGDKSPVELAEESAKEEGQEEFRVAQLEEQQQLDAAWRQEAEHQALLAELKRMEEAGIGLVDHGAEHRFDTSVLTETAGQEWNEEEGRWETKHRLPALTPLAEEAVDYVGGQLAHHFTQGARELGRSLEAEQQVGSTGEPVVRAAAMIRPDWTEYLPPETRTEEGWNRISDRAVTALAAGGAISLGGTVIRGGTALYGRLFAAAAKPKNIDEAAAIISGASIADQSRRTVTGREAIEAEVASLMQKGKHYHVHAGSSDITRTGLGLKPPGSGKSWKTPEARETALREKRFRASTHHTEPQGTSHRSHSHGAVADTFTNKPGAGNIFSLGTTHSYLFELPAGKTLKDVVVMTPPVTSSGGHIAHIPPQYIKAVIEKTASGERVLHILK